MTDKLPHTPVMVEEMLEALQPSDGEIYVDATFGAGGYSEAILKAVNCKVYAIDRDPTVHTIGDKLEARYPGRFTLLQGRFGDMEALLALEGITQVDGIVVDMGMSSMQVDTPERGFSFMREGPLDMRMSSEGESAADIVNTAPEDVLADIIYRYGEERFARTIARAIVRERNKSPIVTTLRLAHIVEHAFGPKQGGVHPATRTFQALRIHVNDELGELNRMLLEAEKLLIPGGRLAIVTFHSLEDRMIKEFLESRSGRAKGISRHVPLLSRKPAPSVFRAIPNKRLIRVSNTEAERNPRARSAKMRLAIRTELPPEKGIAL